MLTDRQSQIVRYGCPKCGEPYTVIFSDKDGVVFECQDDDCEMKGVRIPFKKAAAKCPTSESAIKRQEQLRTDKGNLRVAEGSVKYLREKLARKIATSRADQSYMDKCRLAYKEARKLKIFKKGKRIYDENHPYLLLCPDGTLFQVKNISTKRKANTMLSAMLWFARQQFNYTLSEIVITRERLHKSLDDVRSLRDAVQRAEKRQSASAKRGASR